VGTGLLMEESLEPLWPGSRNTIMPAMLAGAADAGLASVEAATSRQVASAAPTRRQAGTCTESR